MLLRRGLGAAVAAASTSASRRAPLVAASALKRPAVMALGSRAAWLSQNKGSVGLSLAAKHQVAQQTRAFSTDTAASTSSSPAGAPGASPQIIDIVSERGPGIVFPALTAVFGSLLAFVLFSEYAEKQSTAYQEVYNLPKLRSPKAAASGQQSSSLFGDLTSFFSPSDYADAPTSTRAKLRLQGQLESAHAHQLALKLGTGLRHLLNALSFLPREAQVQIGRAYTSLSEAYLDLLPSQRAVIPIIGLNTVVFLACRVPSARLQEFMFKHFTHVPRSRRYHTMLTCVFAHSGFLHFFLNNYVLWSFSQNFVTDQAFREGRGQFDFGFSLEQRAPFRPGFLRTSDAVSDPSARSWTPEASPTPHFLAFWVSAGLFASLGSQLWAATRFRASQFALHRLVRQRAGPDGMSAQTAAEVVRRAEALRTIGTVPGLGASGAMLGTVGAVATCHPEYSIGIVFLPGTAVPAQTAVTGIITFDALSLLATQLNSPLGAFARSMSLGHAAHLAGTLYGIWYASRDDTQRPSGRPAALSNGMALWEAARTAAFEVRSENAEKQRSSVKQV